VRRSDIYPRVTLAPIATVGPSVARTLGKVNSLGQARQASPLHDLGAVTLDMQSASAARAATPVDVAIGSTGSLGGDLAVPDRPRGLVLFTPGSIMRRSAPAAQFLADLLYHHDFATLLVDLLTEREEAIDERTGKLRFDVTLLSTRIRAICSWAQRETRVNSLPVGLFGTNTTTGAALLAATHQPTGFRTIVSYSGRPDLAGSALGRVMIPTLFIVGSADEPLRHLSRHAIDRMHNDARLEIVANASGLFEEPAALESVGQLSAAWFTERLTN
jgi:putative phosphoribosyl transferase